MKIFIKTKKNYNNEDIVILLPYHFKICLNYFKYNSILIYLFGIFYEYLFY